jgi:hypothetical protein
MLKELKKTENDLITSLQNTDTMLSELNTRKLKYLGALELCRALITLSESKKETEIKNIKTEILTDGETKNEEVTNL